MSAIEIVIMDNIEHLDIDLGLSFGFVWFGWFGIRVGIVQGFRSLLHPQKEKV